MVQAKEITKERYENMLNILPPIYVSSIEGNGETITDGNGNTYQVFKTEGFAVSEPYTHTPQTVVLTVCYKELYTKKIDGKLCEAKPPVYKEEEMLMFTPDDQPFFDTYDHCHGRGYKARKFNTG